MKPSLTDSFDTSDMILVYKSGDSDYRVATASQFLAWLKANLSVGSFTTQYASPALTGFSVAITDLGQDIHLILTPTAGFAAGTLVLPLASDLVDGQKLLVNTTQAITTLTITPNGATSVIGAPTTLAANSFFELKYDLPSKNWYRVG